MAMKLNITYRKGGESGEWNSEENEAVSRWNRITLILLVVFAVAAGAGHSAGDLTFEAGHAGGFANWFLYCSAAPVLWIGGLISLFFDFADCRLLQLFHRHPFAGLLAVNIFTYGLIWLLGRIFGLRLLGMNKLRIASNFLLLLACWGIFQLLLFGTATIRQQSSVQLIEQPAAATEQN